jgi:hypothetical protein
MSKTKLLRRMDFYIMSSFNTNRIIATYLPSESAFTTSDFIPFSGWPTLSFCLLYQLIRLSSSGSCFSSDCCPKHFFHSSSKSSHSPSKNAKLLPACLYLQSLPLLYLLIFLSLDTQGTTMYFV